MKYEEKFDSYRTAAMLLVELLEATKQLVHLQKRLLEKGVSEEEISELLDTDKKYY